LSIASRVIRHFDLADTPKVRPPSAAADRRSGPYPGLSEPAPGTGGLDRRWSGTARLNGPAAGEIVGSAGDASPAAPATPLAPPPGRPVPLIYTLLHYVALVLGVVSKCFIESLSRGGRMSWVTLVSSAILAAVVFPVVYKRVCDPTQVGSMQFFVSFQHGFFFQTILEEIQKALI
jgi:hypothetical protein